MKSFKIRSSIQVCRIGKIVFSICGGKKMNKKIIVFGGFLIVFLMLITPTVNGSIAVNKNNQGVVNSQKNDNRNTLFIYFHRIYCFGTIYNLTIYNYTHDLKGYQFTSKNMKMLDISFSNIHSWEIHLEHWPGKTYYFEGIEFKGILKPTFICGFFNLLLL